MSKNQTNLPKDIPDNTQSLAPFTPRKISPEKAVFAGGISGILEVSFSYPFEFLKCYMQLYPEISRGGIIKTTKGIHSSHGYLGFYRGFQALALFSFPRVGSRFGSYEYASHHWFTDKSTTSDILSGFFAGTMEALIALIPMETLKTKQIHDQVSETFIYNGIFHQIYLITTTEGPRGLYQGVGPTVIKLGQNMSMRFTMYNKFVKYFEELMPRMPAMMLSGGLAGGISVYVTNPVDVVKTNMQGMEAHKFDGAMDCMRKIMRNEGVKGFYKGVNPRLIRVVMENALSFTIYEHVKEVVMHIWP